MVNRVMLIGRLGVDPELGYTPSKLAVCRFSVATSEIYIDRNGQRQEQTEWNKIISFGKQAEHCSAYLHKGSLVYIEGSLSTDKWTDKQGQIRRTTEIKARRVQFLERKEATEGKQVKSVDEPIYEQESPNGVDDIPF